MAFKPAPPVRGIPDSPECNLVRRIACPLAAWGTGSLNEPAWIVVAGKYGSGVDDNVYFELTKPEALNLMQQLGFAVNMTSTSDEERKKGGPLAFGKK